MLAIADVTVNPETEKGSIPSRDQIRDLVFGSLEKLHNFNCVVM
jgi:hypothetical protein